MSRCLPLLLLTFSAVALAMWFGTPTASAFSETSTVVSVVDVETAPDRTCLLLSSGNVHCYGSTGPTSAPYVGGDAVKLAIGEKTTCVVRTDATSFCRWTSNYTSTWRDVVDISAGNGHVCAVTSAGRESCLGANDYGQSNPYRGSDLVGVSAGGFHTCVLTASGNVFCRGLNNYGQVVNYTGGDAIAVDTSTFHTCILLRSGNVQCHGSDTYGQSADYMGGDAVAVSAGWQHTCIRSTAGNVDCYGLNQDGQAYDHLSGDIVDVSAANHTCLLFQSGNVHCYGYDGGRQARAYVDGNISALDLGRNHLCLLLTTGNAHCYVTNRDGQAAFHDGGEAIAISGGDLHTCIVFASGNVGCYGGNLHGQADGYSGGDAIDVSAGPRHTCVLRTGGNVACFGDNGDGQSAPYNGGDAVAVSVGQLHTCILRQNGNVYCQGWNHDGQSNPYFGGDAVALDAGYRHTCFVLASGNVKCQGSNTYSENAPYNGGDAVAVSAGYHYTCVLLTSGNTHCYGKSDFRQTMPYQGGDAVAVKAGYAYTCVLRRNATVACQSSGTTDPDAWGWTPADKRAPVVAGLADVTLEATGPAGATASWTATAVDDRAGAVPVVCSTPSGSTFGLGATDVTCTAEDTVGNSHSVTFTVTVLDTTPPTLSVPGPLTVEATGPSGATVAWNTSAHDVVDGATAVACTPTSGSAFGFGTTPVACASTDARGNTASASFTVTVADTTAPTIAPVADVIAEATSAQGAVVAFDAPATSDAVDGAGVAACSPASGATYALGTTTVTCTATDAWGNSAAVTFAITVVDTTPPVIAAMANLTLEATGASGAVATYDAPATNDAVDGMGLAACAPASGSTFELGATTVTCAASDAAGNVATPVVFVVRVVDTTAPALTAPDDQSLEATAPQGAIATFTVSAEDVVDGVFDATCAPASGSWFPLGTSRVTCTATDASGNSASVEFDVEVADPFAPLALLEGSCGQRGTPGWCRENLVVSVRASDRGTGIASLACTVDDAPVDCDAMSISEQGEHVVRVTATDYAGNVGQDTALFRLDSRGPTGAARTPLLTIGGIVVHWTAADPVPGSGLMRVLVQERPLDAAEDAWVAICEEVMTGHEQEGWCSSASPIGSYCYRVIVVDLAGNTYTSSLADTPQPLALQSASCTHKIAP